MATIRAYEKNKHLIGETISGWTILDIVIYENKQHAYAIAQCSCGNIIEVRLSYIINNKTVDCGCGHQSRLNEAIIAKYKHLIDTQINGWTVLEIIPPTKENSETCAKCKCKCGTVKNVILKYLINGKSKDCGCGRKEKLSNKFSKDLTGQKFGKLLVVERILEPDKNRRTLYKCKCDCGNEVIVLGYCLTTYHTLSCGCLTSYWNMYIDKFLTENNIEHKSEYSVYINKRIHRFDFYLPLYNLFIEYDGQQHYEPVRYHGDNEEKNRLEFEKTQKYDEIKNKYCEENGINLLRIPYWESKNIDTIINNHLQRLNEKGFVKST